MSIGQALFLDQRAAEGKQAFLWAVAYTKMEMETFPLQSLLEEAKKALA